jgi:CO dehydrogenase/acetyl-CoA synthase beta subunit
MKYTAEDVYDAVATWNADPFCVETEEEVQEVLDELNNAVVEEHTEENTDPDEWETMCAQLDLRGHKVAKILRTPSLTICLSPDFE